MPSYQLAHPPVPAGAAMQPAIPARGPVRYYGGRQRADFAPLTLPHLSLSPEVLESVPPSQYANANDDNLDFDYESDVNFWRCLNAFVRVTPGAQVPPCFSVEKGNEELLVSRRFLFKFFAAWNMQFPFRICITRHVPFATGEQESSVFYAHEAVWREIESRSVLAAQAHLNHFPADYLLVQCSIDNEMARLIRPDVFAEVAAIWPDQNPHRMDMEAANLARPRPQLQPVVALPQKVAENRHKRPAGAPKSVKNHLPTIRLCIQRNVYDTTVQERSPFRRVPQPQEVHGRPSLVGATTVPVPPGAPGGGRRVNVAAPPPRMPPPFRIGEDIDDGVRVGGDPVSGTSSSPTQPQPSAVARGPGESPSPVLAGRPLAVLTSGDLNPPQRGPAPHTPPTALPIEHEYPYDFDYTASTAAPAAHDDDAVSLSDSLPPGRSMSGGSL